MTAFGKQVRFHIVSLQLVRQLYFSVRLDLGLGHYPSGKLVSNQPVKLPCKVVDLAEPDLVNRQGWGATSRGPKNCSCSWGKLPAPE